MTPFHELFAGRTDAVGGEGGVSIRFANQAEDVILAGEGEWMKGMWAGHLHGTQPIGIYPMRADGKARWGCVDVDTDDRILTQAVYAELWDLGVHPYVEISRSKGYHVWWFYPEFIPGWIPRVLGLTVCARLDVKLEVNPKQFELEKDKLGNYVRLPYPRGYQGTWRRVVIENGEKLRRDAFLEVVRTSHPAASHAAALRSPQCPVECALGVKLPSFPGGPSEGRTGPSGGSAAATQAAFDIAFRGAPVRKGERDNQLFTVANLMWSCGLSEQEAEFRMREIHASQVEEAWSYPSQTAVAKVTAVYKARGMPHRRMPDLRAPIPLI